MTTKTSSPPRVIWKDGYDQGFAYVEPDENGKYPEKLSFTRNCMAKHEGLAGPDSTYEYNIAFGYFCQKMRPEAVRIAESKDKVKHVLQVMWDKTKPNERSEAQSLAYKICRELDETAEFIFLPHNGNYHQVGSVVLVPNEKPSLQKRKGLSGSRLAIEGSSSGIGGQISEEALSADEIKGIDLFKVQQGLFEDEIYERMKADIERQNSELGKIQYFALSNNTRIPVFK